MTKTVTFANSESTWKDKSWFSDEWLTKAYSDGDPDVNYEKRFVFEFTMDDWDSIWRLIKNGLWQTLVDERFGFIKGSLAWSWGKVYLSEIVLSAYYIYIRKIKIGIDVDHHGAYFYDFKDGRPLFEAAFS